MVNPSQGLVRKHQANIPAGRESVQKNLGKGKWDVPCSECLLGGEEQGKPKKKTPVR